MGGMATMKRTIMIIGIVTVLLLAVLFVPIYQGIYDDGGTRVYQALTYKLVVWNRIYHGGDNNGNFVSGKYQRTSILWFSDADKSLNELWKVEMKRSDFLEYVH